MCVKTNTCTCRCINTWGCVWPFACAYAHACVYVFSVFAHLCI